MTYLEKYLSEHSNMTATQIINCKCPEDIEPGECIDIHRDCDRCWLREIPEEPEEKSESDKWICKDCVFMKDRTTEDGSPDPVCTHPHGHEEPCGDIYKCDAYTKSKADPVLNGESPNKPHIKDSGARREFQTGAVRDIQEGKGRCDLLPLDVVATHYAIIFGEEDVTYRIFNNISLYQLTSCWDYLNYALRDFAVAHFKSFPELILEVSKHFEDGAKKYGEYNWQKGIPTHCYVDSAVRHYLKYLRGDKDEPHDRAFVWNIICCIWTCIHKPELNDYAKKEEKSDG